VSILPGSPTSKPCVVVADDGGPGGSGISDIWTIDGSLHTHGPYVSSASYSGYTGVGLGTAIRAGVSYVVVNYSTSNVLETWQINGDCDLTEVPASAIHTTGVHGGAVDGMTYHKGGKFLGVAYEDGSVGTFLVGAGGIITPATPPVIVGGYTASGFNALPTQVDVWASGGHIYLVVGDADYGALGTAWDLYEICTTGCPLGVTPGQIYGDITTSNTTGSDTNVYASNTFVLEQAYNTVHAIGTFDWGNGSCTNSCSDVATDTVTILGVIPDPPCTPAATITNWAGPHGWEFAGQAALSGDETEIYIAMAGLGYNGVNGSVAIVPDTLGCANGTVSGGTGLASGSGLTSPNNYAGVSLQSYPGTPTQ